MRIVEKIPHALEEGIIGEILEMMSEGGYEDGMNHDAGFNRVVNDRRNPECRVLPARGQVTGPAWE